MSGSLIIFSLHGQSRRERDWALQFSGVRAYNSSRPMYKHLLGICMMLAVAGTATAQKPTVDGVDLEKAYANLKESESKKDYDGVLKWSGVTSEIARKTVAGPKLEGQSDEDFKQAVDYARQVDVYTEYSLYAMMLQEPDPQKAMKLADTLE